MKNQSDIINEIIGTWKLISIYYKYKNGNKENMYGPNPIGILMYDKSGNMNAQLGYRGREITYKNSYSNNDQIKASCFDTYMCYYGSFYEESPGIVIHHVVGCTNPTWINRKEIRYIKIENNILKIDTPEMEYNGEKVILEVMWEKEK